MKNTIDTLCSYRVCESRRYTIFTERKNVKRNIKKSLLVRPLIVIVARAAAMKTSVGKRSVAAPKRITPDKQLLLLFRNERGVIDEKGGGRIPRPIINVVKGCCRRRQELRKRPPVRDSFSLHIIIIIICRHLYNIYNILQVQAAR